MMMMSHGAIGSNNKVAPTPSSLGDDGDGDDRNRDSLSAAPPSTNAYERITPASDTNGNPTFDTRNLSSSESNSKHTADLDLSQEYSKLLFIKDPSIRQQYNEQRAFTNTSSPQSYFIMALVLLCLTVTKGNLQNIFVDNIWWNIFHGLLITYFPLRMSSLAYAFTTGRSASFLSASVKANIVILFSSLIVCSIFSARVMNGTCDSDPGIKTLWGQQSCNPSAPHALPIESNLLFIWLPLMQITNAGGSWSFVIIGHVIVLATLMCQCLWVMKLSEWPYFLLFYVYTLVCSYEIEHQRIVAFFSKLHIRSQAQELAKRIEEMNNREHDRKMVALKAVLGCVAHDLQTPMQAILMEIAWLINELRTNFPHLVDIIHAAAQAQVASEFMSSNIRRALQFIKTHSNVSLVPAMSSFNVNEAVNQAIIWISALKNASCTLHFNRLPPAQCACILSDREWLIDNMLCLLSNAVKYSAKNSTVTVSLEIVASSAAPIQTFQSTSMANEVRAAQPIANDATMVKTEHLPLMILVSVQDSGIGVPEENRDRLFKPFSTLQVKLLYLNTLQFVYAKNKIKQY